MEGPTIDSAATPYEGLLIQSLQWTDQAGENVLLFSGRPAYPISEDLRKAEFYVRAYTRSPESSTLQWEIREVVDSCYCDCAVELAEGPLEILDIDQDGRAEACFLFFRNDLCDASPMPTKLIIASGAGTYFLEGHTRLFLAPESPFFRKIARSENFDQAPSSIREYATEYWNTYIQKEEAAFEVFKKEKHPDPD
jgi:hypothetical protein